MATNPDQAQGKLEGVDYDCELRLLKPVTHIDSETAPRLGDNVRFVINGRITDSGQKVVADAPHPYLKALVESMQVEIVPKGDGAQ